MQNHHQSQQIRLQKVLASATSLSRRAAEDAIRKGLVSVNGTVVTKLGTKVDPRRDNIRYRGQEVKPLKEKFYFAFNKPHNTIVSKSDPQGRQLIWDSLPPEMKSVLDSAGRLDFDSEGLLILSNDGEFINYLTHPSHDISKTYLVKVKGIPTEKALASLKNGVKLEDGVTSPAKIRITRQVGNHTWLEISINEGRNRQVRRMCAAVGHLVLKLRRTGIGHIKLGALRSGKWRMLNRRDVLKI